MKKLASLGNTSEQVFDGFRGAVESAQEGKVIGYALGSLSSYTWQGSVLMRREPDNGQRRKVEATSTELEELIEAISGGYFTVYHVTKDESGRVHFKLLHAATTHPPARPTNIIRTPPRDILSSAKNWQQPSDVPTPKPHSSSRSRGGVIDYTIIEAEVDGASYLQPRYLICATDWRGTDINPLCAKMAHLNMRLHRLCSKIAIGDALSNEIDWAHAFTTEPDVWPIVSTEQLMMMAAQGEVEKARLLQRMRKDMYCSSSKRAA